jgi:hypothetical protein
MNDLAFIKAMPTRLKSLGLNEYWLQDQIETDPSILGLGNLDVLKKEKIQPSGGRIDFVLGDSSADTRYEVEVMLGAVDASHIIRTIEYWDIERQRYPTVDHRAVIIAEEITSRFFNVIRLLNRAVPIIAIQLSAFQFDKNIVLQFVRVLDTYEFGGGPEDDDVQVDRAVWIKRATQQSLAIVDVVKELAATASGNDVRLIYNKHHIALATGGYNFAWCWPRRVATHCPIRLRVGPEERQKLVEELEEAGLNVQSSGQQSIRLMVGQDDLLSCRDIIIRALRQAEIWSHR